MQRRSVVLGMPAAALLGCERLSAPEHGASGGAEGGGEGGAAAQRPGSDAPAWLRQLPGGFVGPSPQQAHAALGVAVGGVGTAERGEAALPEQRVQVLVAGAGVAGLAAARGLRQAGVEDLAVLELQEAPGGNARAGTLGGLPCPWGAHYLPVPGPEQPELQALLGEMGVLVRDAAGRWQPEERHLCHSPQERLWWQGQWHSGLLPLEGASAATQAQAQRLAQALEQLRRAAAQAGQPFAVPSPLVGMGGWALARASGGENARSKPLLAPIHQALDAMTFEAWLAQQGVSDPLLRWYLDYVCHDEYGAGVEVVSAWAGVHYFAARHGFVLPGRDAEASHPVLTWPEGNARIVTHLARPLGPRLHTGWAVQRLGLEPGGVWLQAQHLESHQRRRWRGRYAILALPAQVLRRLLAQVAGEPSAAQQAQLDALRQAASGVRHAAWVVSNLHLREPLRDRGGAAPAWDNVAAAPAGPQGQARGPGFALGYVDATHQALFRPPSAPTVLTAYRALGTGAAARAQLLQAPWWHWVALEVAEWAEAHPELPERLTRATVARHGHGMAVPTPGMLAQNVRWRLLAQRSMLSKKDSRPRLLWAHSDASGLSTFEEAFAQGLAAARLLAAAQA